jgi:hypothetical protein
MKLETPLHYYPSSQHMEAGAQFMAGSWGDFISAVLSASDLIDRRRASRQKAQSTTYTQQAVEASRMARAFEAAKQLDAVVFWNGDGACTLDSWKTDPDGKRRKDRYEVDLDAYTCTCPAYADDKTFCKHLIYADFLADDIAAGEAQELLLGQMDADADAAELYPY